MAVEPRNRIDPRTEVSTGRRKQSAVDSVERFGSRSCLVTDDSPAVRKVLRRILESLDFEIYEAEDGRAALAKCARRMPDVILLDWNMPTMNGIDFLRSLRATEGGNSPRIIFCAGERDVTHVREVIEAGADEYVIKPIEVEPLLAKLGR